MVFGFGFIFFFHLHSVWCALHAIQSVCARVRVLLLLLLLFRWFSVTHSHTKWCAFTFIFNLLCVIHTNYVIHFLRFHPEFHWISWIRAFPFVFRDFVFVDMTMRHMDIADEQLKTNTKIWLVWAEIGNIILYWMYWMKHYIGFIAHGKIHTEIWVWCLM